MNKPDTRLASTPVGAVDSDEWPRAELESLGRCPVCEEPQRQVWRSGVRDLVFRAAAGRWTLWGCSRCKAAYLDPRPDARSIGRAYKNYYTHAGKPAKHFLVPGDKPEQWLKRAVRASYYRWRFGHQLRSALPLGWILIAASERRRARADQSIRHLPAAPPGGILLDVGCGDGSFLRVGRALGYTAEGIETDEAAAQVAKRAGFAVHPGADHALPLLRESVDQITLNHVIEHLHNPVASLQLLLGALRPGGRIWLQTPNIDGLGAAKFGQAWRGLEAPRHLVLFNQAGLRSALEAAGFIDVQLMTPQADGAFYVAQSRAMQEARDPYADSGGVKRRESERIGEAWNRIALRDPGKAESITMVAFKRSVS